MCSVLVSGCLFGQEQDQIVQNWLDDYQQELWIEQEALKVALLPQSMSAPMLEIFKDTRPVSEDGEAPRRFADEVMPLVRRSLRYSRQLGPDRRAAALVAVDILVFHSHYNGFLIYRAELGKPEEKEADGHQYRKSRAERELERLGARFGYTTLGATWIYQRNWLWQARALDPSGRAGALAILELARNGFDTSGVCANGQEQFRAVIRELGRFLRTSKWNDISARAHFLLGDAYSDPVALDAGVEEYVPPEERFKGWVRSARAAAIGHFRAGLQIDRDSVEARLAAKKLSRLLAGKAPERTYFYCIYD